LQGRQTRSESRVSVQAGIGHAAVLLKTDHQFRGSAQMDDARRFAVEQGSFQSLLDGNEEQQKSQ
jgi:hypothetical protein